MGWERAKPMRSRPINSNRGAQFMESDELFAGQDRSRDDKLAYLLRQSLVVSLSYLSVALRSDTGSCAFHIFISTLTATAYAERNTGIRTKRVLYPSSCLRSCFEKDCLLKVNSMGSVEVTIPVIDVAGYLSGDPAAKKAAADEVREAYENQGFLQVIGHSVSPDLQDRYLAAVAEFFALPPSEKEKVAQTNSKCFRGYERIGGQKLDELDDDATPDQKEGFSIRQERPLGRFLEGPNQWPEAMPGFEKIYMEYFNAVHDLSKAMFKLIALSLRLPEDHFDYFASDPNGEKCVFSLSSVQPDCEHRNMLM